MKDPWEQLIEEEDEEENADRAFIPARILVEKLLIKPVMDYIAQRTDNDDHPKTTSEVFE